MGSYVSKNEALKCDLVKLFGEQKDNLEIAAQSIKVLSHPVRLRIICALRDSEQTVQNLGYYTGIWQTALSQHLSLLKSRGVLVSRREETYSFYQISNKKIDLFDMIKKVYST